MKTKTYYDYSIPHAKVANYKTYKSRVAVIQQNMMLCDVISDAIKEGKFTTEYEFIEFIPIDLSPVRLEFTDLEDVESLLESGYKVQLLSERENKSSYDVIKYFKCKISWSDV